VTDPSRFEPAAAEPDTDADVEVVDALPVPEAHEIPAPPASTPAPAEPTSRGGLVIAAPVAVQAAAVAVTGFAAGAATVAVVRRARARKQVRARRSGKDKRGDIRATRSFLVDVHLLNRD
jgi:hypothetical protein